MWLRKWELWKDCEWTNWWTGKWRRNAYILHINSLCVLTCVQITLESWCFNHRCNVTGVSLHWSGLHCLEKHFLNEERLQWRRNKAELKLQENILDVSVNYSGLHSSKTKQRKRLVDGRKVVLQPSSGLSFRFPHGGFFVQTGVSFCCEYIIGNRVFLLFVWYLYTVLDKSLKINYPNSGVDPDLWICNDLCMLSFSIWQVHLSMLPFGRSGGH